MSNYALHAHGSSFSGDYDAVFSSLANIQPRQRIVNVSGLTIGISRIEKSAKGYFIQFIEGEVGANPLILNLQTGIVRIEELARNEMIGAASHMLVYPKDRRALVEYVKNGPKVEVIQASIEAVLRSRIEKYADLTIEFAPVVRESFVKEIEGFNRIRVASLTVVKPNAGWTDHYSEIADMLDKSNGKKAKLSVSAPRSESLQKNRGISLIWLTQK